MQGTANISTYSEGIHMLLVMSLVLLATVILTLIISVEGSETNEKS
ncbi:hypothetical protein SAMN04487975_10552 [Planococcus glaciei]|nr:hypothetical protein SAMN04487975_10552 [Planococcus glaciei]